MGIARLRDVPRNAPSMLNIEHLRKQAKLYLRWHREHYHPVAARIRAVLPRYSRLTDREILARPFRLSDAQELVARTVGFESWEALRRGRHFVMQTRTGTRAMPTLVAAEPQLFVRDVVLSSDHPNFTRGSSASPSPSPTVSRRSTARCSATAPD